MKLLPDVNLHKNLIGRGLGTSKPILRRHLPNLRYLLPCGSERAHMRARSALGVMAYLDTPFRNIQKKIFDQKLIEN